MEFHKLITSTILYPVLTFSFFCISVDIAGQENTNISVGLNLYEANTTEVRNYNFNNEDPQTVRDNQLASTSINGSPSYFKKIESEIKENKPLEITRIFPTPIKSNVTVQLKSTRSGSLKLSVFDSVKSLQQVINVDSRKGLNVTQIDLENLASGTYMLILDDGINKVEHEIVKS